MTCQVAPREVSRAKFDREVEAFRQLETSHRRRGWILLRAEFPLVEVLFLTPNAQLRMALLTARIDFTNYDADPPSVRFIDPITGRVLNAEEMPERMLRIDPAADPLVVKQALAGLVPMPVAQMIQGYQGQPGFLCMPGVREYHDNPAHTGDSWMLHRHTGEGRLFNLLDKISRYGSEAITGLQAQVLLQRPGVSP